MSSLIYVRKELKMQLLRRQAFPEVCWIAIPPLLIGACYVKPYNCHDSDPFEDLALQLHSLKTKNPNLKYTLLVGDFNARCGLLLDALETQEGDETLEESGPALGYFPPRVFQDHSTRPWGPQCVAFCRAQGLVIANGRAPGDIGGKATFHCRTHTPCPGAEPTTGVLDLSIVSRELFPFIRNLKVEEPTVLSDHSLVTLWMDLPPQEAMEKSGGKGRKRCRWDQDRRHAYGREVSTHRVQSKLEGVVREAVRGSEESFDEVAVKMGDILSKVTHSVFKHTHTPQRNSLPEWWDDECEERRQRTYRQFNRNRRHPIAKALKKAFNRCKTLKTAVFRRDLERRRLTMLIKQGGKFHGILRANSKPPVLDDPEPWFHHFSQLLNERRPDPGALGGEIRARLLRECRARTAVIPQEAFQALNAPITEEDVRRAMAKAANNKSTADGIPMGIYKYAESVVPGTRMVDNWTAVYWTQVFNEAFLERRRLPASMHGSHVTPIFKGKGSQLDMNNYRGITLTTSPYKLFMLILNDRAVTLCEDHGLRAPTQCGFRQKLGTIDAIFALNHHIHSTCTPVKQGGQGRPLHICFIDFQKAFDVVVRSYMWDRLRAVGFSGPFLDVILDIYRNSTFRIRVGGRISSGLVVTVSGVKQGCPLSPILFTLFIDQLHEFLQLKCPNLGVVVVDEELLSDLLYCDDLGLLALLRDDLQQLLNAVADFSSAHSQPVNVPKTQSLTCTPGSAIEVIPLKYGSETIEEVDTFKYLGLILDNKEWFSKAGERMVESAGKAMWALLRLCRERDIRLLESICRLFTVKVAAVGNYGCQVWGVEYLNFDDDSHVFDNPLQKLLFVFLRYISGCHRSVHRYTLLLEFGFKPYQVQYARLCARYWNKAREDGGLSGKHLKANLLLFQRGNNVCWTAKFLKCMNKLGLGPSGSLIGLRSLDHIVFTGNRI